MREISRPVQQQQQQQQQQQLCSFELVKTLLFFQLLIQLSLKIQQQAFKVYGSLESDPF
jgi:hypothetical protein